MSSRKLVVRCRETQMPLALSAFVGRLLSICVLMLRLSAAEEIERQTILTVTMRRSVLLTSCKNVDLMVRASVAVPNPARSFFG